MSFFKNIIEKYSFLRILSNRYVLVSIAFSVWMLFLDNTSYLEQRVLNKQLEELEENKKYYQEEIQKDKKNIKQLKNPNNLEKYAREKYYMKRDSEDIYIIEFDDDIPNKEQSKSN